LCADAFSTSIQILREAPNIPCSSTGSLTGGLSLAVGFLTPAAAALLALSTAGIALSWLPAPTPNLVAAPLSAVLLVTIDIAVALLGPGSFSVDSRLFGRREIIIPDVPHPSQKN
jgi:uncharacterized membrane protein YphA (DoxX/SURF4 family)